MTGRITASRLFVHNASITFIDVADTTRQFTTLTSRSGAYAVDVMVAVGSQSSTTPHKFELAQNYPNPFSHSTAIPYKLDKHSLVDVTIYDVLGRKVRTFEGGTQTAGAHHLIWDARDDYGRSVANGIYFYQLHTESGTKVGKMILNGTRESVASHAVPAHMPKTAAPALLSGTYNVRIENTNDTNPSIITKHFDNIVVKNDTTINFSVEYLASSSIDFDSTHQIIRGFGASNIVAWRPDMTDSEIETAFGTDEGQLGFSILRLMVEPEEDRWSRNLSTAKKADAMGVTLIASPWHAPSDMRQSIGDNYRVHPDRYEDYAEHLNAFNYYMSTNGLQLYGLSVQNEPDIGDWTRWSIGEMFTFVRDYAHIIEGTRVMAPESFNYKASYSDRILNDPVASENVDVICGHIYGAGREPYPLAEEKGKERWMTEYLSGEDDTNNTQTWQWAMHAVTSINDVMQAGMSAYVWWYLVRYYGPISDGTNNSGSKGEVTKKGYAMSQYSRFIRPGFFRVEATITPTRNLAITAYKDETTSKAVIVVINTDSSPRYAVLNLANCPTQSFIPYTTSASKNVVAGDEIAVNANSITVTLDASSITTFVSKK